MLQINLNDAEMQPCGDEDSPESYLLGQAVIAHRPFHVEAMQIEPCDCGCGPHWCSDTQAVDLVREEVLQEAYAAVGGDGPWQGIEHNGKWYIVLVFPFSQ